MTQLNLFDSLSISAADSTTAGIVAVEPATYTVAAPVAKTETRPNRRRRRRKNSSSDSQDSIEGVQRMGDLARFVIMRYELAVKYREEMEARRGQPAK
ncbi:hypothetical protein [Planctomycetes bacterium K23_9]|uniref:Uncharacterized protein n=1 Tax=Stieleria marina TaxID=1930275 RepID=A0A517NVX3_9BACT|nr:hypothetical protein K239x_32650 [Planctomycetes bacterium K23_9]